MDKISGSKPIELFDQGEGEVIVSFSEGLDGKPSFNRKYEILINDLDRGIRLPESLRKNYGDKLALFPKDKGFGTLFYHWYFPSNLAGVEGYIWRSIKK
jgi:hypothetical protein